VPQGLVGIRTEFGAGFGIGGPVRLGLPVVRGVHRCVVGDLQQGRGQLLRGLGAELADLVGAADQVAFARGQFLHGVV